MMISKKSFLKTIAGFTALCFLSTNLYAVPAQELPRVVPLSSSASREVSVVSLADKIEIPENLGRIQKRFSSSRPSLSTVIHLQDAHSNYEAQKNIYRLLNYLQKNYQVRALFLEGAVDRLRPELMDFFQDAKLNTEFVKLLEKKGLAGGTERFLLESQRRSKAVPGYGIEDPGLYGANLRTFREVAAQKNAAENFLRHLQGQIDRRASIIFNKELKDFFRNYSFYQEHSEALPAYLQALQTESKTRGILDLLKPESQLDWPQLVRFSRLQELEKQINVERAQAEARALQAWMKDKNIKNGAFENLLKAVLESGIKTDNPRMAAEKFYGQASAYGFTFEKYTELSKALGNIVLRSELEAASLFGEIQELSAKVLERLAATPDEKKLIGDYELFLKLKKLFHLELLRSEYQSLTANRKESLPSIIFERYYEKNAAVAGHDWEALDKLFEKALSFYEGAIKREETMYDRMIQEVARSKAEVAVLVTGGFHGAGLAEKMEAQGISYIQAVPHISDLKDSNGYQRVMTLGAEKSSVNHPSPANTLTQIAETDAGMGRFYREGIEQTLQEILGTMPEGRRSEMLTRLKNSPAAAGHDLKTAWSSAGFLTSSKNLESKTTAVSARAEIRSGEKARLIKAFKPSGVITGLEDIEIEEVVSAGVHTPGRVEDSAQFFWPHAMAAANGAPWRGDNGNSFIKDRADAALLAGLDQGFQRIKRTILRVISNEGGRDFAPSFKIGVLSYFTRFAETTGHPFLNAVKRLIQSLFGIARVDWWGDVLEVTNAFVKAKVLGAVSMGAFVPKDAAVSFPDFYLFRWAMRKDIPVDQIHVSRNILEDTEHNINLLLAGGKKVSELKIALLIRPRHKAILTKLKELGVEFAPEDAELDVKKMEKKAKEKGYYRSGNVFLLADGDMMPVFRLISGPEDERLDAVIGAGGSNEVETSALVAQAAGIPVKAMLLPSKALAEEVTDASIQGAPFSDEEREKLLEHNLYPADVTQAEKDKIQNHIKVAPYALNAHLTEEQRDVNHVWTGDELLRGQDGVFYAANLLRPGQANPWLQSLEGIHFDPQTGRVKVWMVQAGLSGNIRVFKIVFETGVLDLRERIQSLQTQLAGTTAHKKQQYLQDELAARSYALAKILAHFQEYEKAEYYFQIAELNVTTAIDRAKIQSAREHYEGLHLLVNEKESPNEKALKLFLKSLHTGIHEKTNGPDGTLTMAYLLAGQIIEKLNAAFADTPEDQREKRLEFAVRIDDYLRTRVSLAQKLHQDVSRERTEHDKIRYFIEHGSLPPEDSEGTRNEIRTAAPVEFLQAAKQIVSSLTEIVFGVVRWIAGLFSRLLQRKTQKGKALSGMELSGSFGPGSAGGRLIPVIVDSGIAQKRSELRAAKAETKDWSNNEEDVLDRAILKNAGENLTPADIQQIRIEKIYLRLPEIEFPKKSAHILKISGLVNLDQTISSTPRASRDLVGQIAKHLQGLIGENHSFTFKRNEPGGVQVYFPDTDLKTFKMVLQELLINALWHGNKLSPARPIYIAWNIQPKTLTLRVYDTAKETGEYVTAAWRQNRQFMERIAVDGEGLLMVREFVPSFGKEWKNRHAQEEYDFRSKLAPRLPHPSGHGELGHVVEIKIPISGKRSELRAAKKDTDAPGRGAVAVKKAPGTEDLSNAEEIFYMRLSELMKLKDYRRRLRMWAQAHQDQDAKIQEIIKSITPIKDPSSNQYRMPPSKNIEEARAYLNAQQVPGLERPLVQTAEIPAPILAMVEAQFPVSDKIKRELGILDAKSARKGRDPKNFREMLAALLATGRVKIQIDDLSDKKFIKKEALHYARRNVTLNGDQYLYPRFDVLKNPLGTMSFVTEEDDPATKKPVVLIHISRKLWNEIVPQGADANGKPNYQSPMNWNQPGNNIYLFSQLVLHQLFEHFAGTQPQITKHRFAGILELFAASPEARKKGLSDVNLWYLQHGNLRYYNILEEQFQHVKDLTLGGFYKAMWDEVRKKKLHLARAVRQDDWIPERRNHPIKRAYTTPFLNMDQRRIMEKYYEDTSDRASSESDVPVPAEVVQWIKDHAVGESYGDVRVNKTGYPGLLSLIGSNRTGNDRIVFRIDSIGEGKYFYDLPESRGSQNGKVLFYLTQKTSQDPKDKGKPTGPVEIHVTKALWDSVWAHGSAEGMTPQEHPAFLAQIVAFTYIQAYLSENEGLYQDTWADLNALHFASARAKSMWMNDMTLFILDHAARTNDVRYLYNILWNYDMARDPQCNARTAFFETMNKVYERHPEFFIDAIESEKDLAMFYTYIFEERLSNVPLDRRLQEVAKVLHAAAKRNKVVAKHLNPENSSLFMKVSLDELDENSRPVLKRGKPRKFTAYILQGVETFLPYFVDVSEGENFKIGQQAIEDLEATEQLLSRQINWLHIRNEEKSEAEQKIDELKKALAENPKPAAAKRLRADLSAAEAEKRRALAQIKKLSEHVQKLRQELNELWGDGATYPQGTITNHEILSTLRITEETQKTLDALEAKAQKLVRLRDKKVASHTAGYFERRSQLLKTLEAKEAELDKENRKGILDSKMTPEALSTLEGEISALKKETKPLREILDLNKEIQRLHVEMAGLMDRPFGEWLVRKTREMKQKQGKKRIFVGIYGGPGTGKTTATGILRDQLALAASDFADFLNDKFNTSEPDTPENPRYIWRARGDRINYVGTDPYLKGSWIRYENQPGGGRWTLVSGPGIYNDIQLQRLLKDLRAGEEALTPKDSEASYSPRGTTFDDIAYKGRRLINGRYLETLILDLTVFGLSPAIESELDLIIPVTFKDDKIRLLRRFYRDTMPKWQGGGRGDSKNYVAGDFAQKQIQEGLFYKLRTILRHIGTPDDPNPMYVWSHDQNKLLVVGPKRSEIRSGEKKKKISATPILTEPTRWERISERIYPFIFNPVTFMALTGYGWYLFYKEQRLQIFGQVEKNDDFKTEILVAFFNLMMTFGGIAVTLVPVLIFRYMRGDTSVLSTSRTVRRSGVKPGQPAADRSSETPRYNLDDHRGDSTRHEIRAFEENDASKLMRDLLPPLADELKQIQQRLNDDSIGFAPYPNGTFERAVIDFEREFLPQTADLLFEESVEHAEDWEVSANVIFHVRTILKGLQYELETASPRWRENKDIARLHPELVRAVETAGQLLARFENLIALRKGGLELKAGDEKNSDEVTYLYHGRLNTTVYETAQQIVKRNGLDRSSDVRIKSDKTFYEGFFDPEEPESSDVLIEPNSLLTVRLSRPRHEIRAATPQKLPSKLASIEQWTPGSRIEIGKGESAHDVVPFPANGLWISREALTALTQKHPEGLKFYLGNDGLNYIHLLPASTSENLLMTVMKTGAPKATRQEFQKGMILGKRPDAGDFAMNFLRQGGKYRSFLRDESGIETEVFGGLNASNALFIYYDPAQQVIFLEGLSADKSPVYFDAGQAAALKDRQTAVELGGELPTFASTTRKATPRMFALRSVRFLNEDAVPSVINFQMWSGINQSKKIVLERRLKASGDALAGGIASNREEIYYNVTVESVVNGKTEKEPAGSLTVTVNLEQDPAHPIYEGQKLKLVWNNPAAAVLQASLAGWFNHFSGVFTKSNDTFKPRMIRQFHDMVDEITRLKQVASKPVAGINETQLGEVKGLLDQMLQELTEHTQKYAANDPDNQLSLLLQAAEETLTGMSKRYPALQINVPRFEIRSVFYEIGGLSFVDIEKNSLGVYPSSQLIEEIRWTLESYPALTAAAYLDKKEDAAAPGSVQWYQMPAGEQRGQAIRAFLNQILPSNFKQGQQFEVYKALFGIDESRQDIIEKMNGGKAGMMLVVVPLSKDSGFSGGGDGRRPWDKPRTPQPSGTGAVPDSSAEMFTSNFYPSGVPAEEELLTVREKRNTQMGGTSRAEIRVEETAEMLGMKFLRRRIENPKARVLVVEPVSNEMIEVMRGWNDVDFDVLLPESELDENNQPSIKGKLARLVRENQYDVVLGYVNGAFDEEFFKAANTGGHKLRLFATFGTGTDNIDKKAAEKYGTVVTHAPGPLTTAMAELNIGAALDIVYGGKVITNRTPPQNFKKLSKILKITQMRSAKKNAAQVMWYALMNEVLRLPEMFQFVKDGRYVRTGVGENATILHDELGMNKTAAIHTSLGISGLDETGQTLVDLAIAHEVETIYVTESEYAAVDVEVKNRWAGLIKAVEKAAEARKQEIKITIRPVSRREFAQAPDYLIRTAASPAMGYQIPAKTKVIDADKIYLKNETVLGESLSGLTLGIQGFGRIGEAVAQRAAILGMHVVAYQRNYETPEYEAKRKTQQVFSQFGTAIYGNPLSMHYYNDTETVFRSSHIITTLIPPTDEKTIGWVNPEMLKIFYGSGRKPVLGLINSGRGKILGADKTAEQQVFEFIGANRRIQFRPDVVVDEPGDKTHLFRAEWPNIKGTGHTGSAVRQVRDAMVRRALEKNVRVLIEGGRPENPVRSEIRAASKKTGFNFTAAQNKAIDKAAEAYQLKPEFKDYLRVMVWQAWHPEAAQAPLKIRLHGEEGNYRLTAQMTPEEIESIFKASHYATQVAGNAQYAEAAQRAFVDLYSLDGGLGENLGRWEFLEWLIKKNYLKESDVIRGPDNRILLGAKGTDIRYPVRFGKKRYALSIAEAKLMQLLYLTETKALGGLRFKPLVNHQSAASYQKLLASPYLKDVLDGKKQPRTYAQVLEEKGIEVVYADEARKELYLAQNIPAIRMDGNKVIEPAQSAAVGVDIHGGHGMISFDLLHSPENWKPRADGKSSFVWFSNGDGLNSSLVSPFTIGQMILNQIPVMNLLTAASQIDVKGGKNGVKKVIVELPGGLRAEVEVPQQMELADAKANGQAKEFEAAGQPAGVEIYGEQSQGRQLFNTNIFVLQLDLLMPMLAQIKAELGAEEYYKIIAPTRIEKPLKKGKDGKSYQPVDGAIGTSIHNLNEFIQTTRNAKVLSILKQYGFAESVKKKGDNKKRLWGKGVLHFTVMDRGRIFTPTKTPFDPWMQGFSDYYEWDYETSSFKDAKQGLVPPKVSLEGTTDGWWGELGNLIRAFGLSGRIQELHDLKIYGKVILSKNGGPVRLAHNVKIFNTTGKIANVYGAAYKKTFEPFIQENQLNLSGVTVILTPYGDVTSRLTNLYEISGLEHQPVIRGQLDALRQHLDDGDFRKALRTAKDLAQLLHGKEGRSGLIHLETPYAVFYAALVQELEKTRVILSHAWAVVRMEKVIQEAHEFASEPGYEKLQKKLLVQGLSSWSQGNDDFALASFEEAIANILDHGEASEKMLTWANHIKDTIRYFRRVAIYKNFSKLKQMITPFDKQDWENQLNRIQDQIASSNYPSAVSTVLRFRDQLILEDASGMDKNQQRTLKAAVQEVDHLKLLVSARMIDRSRKEIRSVERPDLQDREKPMSQILPYFTVQLQSILNAYNLDATIVAPRYPNEQFKAIVREEVPKQLPAVIAALEKARGTIGVRTDIPEELRSAIILLQNLSAKMKGVAGEWTKSNGIFSAHPSLIYADRVVQRLIRDFDELVIFRAEIRTSWNEIPGAIEREIGSVMQFVMQQKPSNPGEMPQEQTVAVKVELKDGEISKQLHYENLVVWPGGDFGVGKAVQAKLEQNQNYTVTSSLKDGVINVQITRAEIRQPVNVISAETDEILNRYLLETGITFESLREVYEFVAQRTVAVLPRETAEAALKALESRRDQQLKNDGLALDRIKTAVRKAMGPYAGLLDRRSGEKPVELVIPVDFSAKPEDLALLVTLIASKEDMIHVLLQDEKATDASAEELASQIAKALAGWNVRAELIRQVQVHAVPNSKSFAVQTQRIIGNRNSSNSERGLASSDLRDLKQVPDMPGVYEMLSPERLKHPYAIALLAAAYLRDARDAAKMGTVLNLEVWMKSKGIQVQGLLEGISLAVKALQRMERAA